MNLKLLNFFKSNWNRVISLDLETRVIEGQFLKNERILAISYARRINGKFMETKGIETNTLILQNDSIESELELFQKFNIELKQIRPLCVVGYGLRYYDIPLLHMKRRHYNIPMWNIVDLIESTFQVDLYHILKYKRYKKLADVISSDEFSDLPLKRTKDIVSKSGMKKGEDIYRLWKDSKNGLINYVEGDTHDPLLIIEKLMLEFNEKSQ